MSEVQRNDYITVAVERRDETLAVRLAGELDHASARWALAAIEPALQSLPTRTVLLDLASVTFCDGGGVHLLLRLQRRARAADGFLAVDTMSPCVERVLAICEVPVAVSPDVAAIPARSAPSRRGGARSQGRCSR